MMEIQVKKAVKAGNSSAVILPRSWLNKEVRVEIVKKTPEIILSDVLYIVKNYLDLSDIIGVYLTGSYARGEEDKYSDIDILVITTNIDREIIREGNYNILLVSIGLLRQKLEKDLFPIGQMIKEAKPLLNSYYLGSIKIKVTEKNVKWYINTTVNKLKIIEKAIEILKKRNKKYVSDLVAYTLILRIRTLYIIETLLENWDYSKKEFLKLIKSVSGGNNTYERYLTVKNDLEVKNGITLKEAEALTLYLRNQLNNIKKLLEKS